MEIERIVRKIESDTLTLENLSKYQGKEVEILIVPREGPRKPSMLKSLYGTMERELDGIAFQRKARAEW